MEAPKKIYLYPSDRAGEEYENEWGDKPWGEGNVEYTRTDVFIEKACEWIKSHGGFTLGFDGATVRDFLNFINK